MVFASQISLELDFLLPNAMSFVPMDLGLANDAVRQFYSARTFQLSPIRLSVDLVQSIHVLDTIPVCKDFDVLNWPDDLDVHFAILPFSWFSSCPT